MKSGSWWLPGGVFASLLLSSCAASPPSAPAPAPAPAPAAAEPAMASADGLVRPGEGDRAVLRVGQVLEIALETNPSTGYQWQLVSDGAPALARAAGPATPPPMDTQAPVPGAPRIARWWFRAEQPGEAVVKLEYRRPWEKDVPAARAAEYTVRVE